MTFLELAEQRYSVRKYSSRAVEQEKLDRIIRAALAAPTAVNAQPWRMYVLCTPEALAKVDQTTRCRFGAGVVLHFTRRTDEEWKNPLEPGMRAGVEDASIAAVHAMLEAQELGLGTCWVNYYAYTKLEKLFGLDENEKSVLLMPLGYPAENSVPAVQHKIRRKAEELVTYL